MKILVHIDQRAAIAAGIDAPHSSARVEFDPQAVNDPGVLRIVSDHLNLRTGEVEMPAEVRPKFLRAPTTAKEIEEKFAEAMWRWAERSDAPEWLQRRLVSAREDTMEVLEKETTRLRPGSTAIAERGADGKITLRVDHTARLETDASALQACVAFEEHEPAWPDDPYPPIVQSVEAERWRAQLQAENEDAAREACDTAALRLEGKEEMLAGLREKERREQEAQEQRESARLERYGAWVQQHGSPLARARLNRRWLSADEIFPMILAHKLQDWPQAFLGLNDRRPGQSAWLAVAAQDDDEMAAILEVEDALARAGMAEVVAAPAVEALVRHEATLGAPTANAEGTIQIAREFGYAAPDEIDACIGGMLDRAIHGNAVELLLKRPHAGGPIEVRWRVRLDRNLCWVSKPAACPAELAGAILDRLEAAILEHPEPAGPGNPPQATRGLLPWIVQIGRRVMPYTFHASRWGEADGTTVFIRLPTDGELEGVARDAGSPPRRAILASFRWPEYPDEGVIEAIFAAHPPAPAEPAPKPVRKPRRQPAGAT